MIKIHFKNQPFISNNNQEKQISSTGQTNRQTDGQTKLIEDKFLKKNGAM